MEYGWPQAHDALMADANLAEIDFEDFRNEDLAYAFSCEEESAASSMADMSICRSEALFNSMRESASASGLEATAEDKPDVVEDSLVLTDDDFRANKNNYTLTYSSMHQAMAAASVYVGADDLPSAQFPTTLTTWSNLGNNRQQSNNNSNNNNEDEEDEESSPAAAKSELANNARLTTTFMRKRDLSWEASEAEAADPNAIPMMRSKDTVNQFLKATAAATRLTSIAEAASSSSSTSTSSGNNNTSAGASAAASAGAKRNFPSLDFLGNDVGMWDAFFMHSRTSSKFPSVLRPSPVEDYVRVNTATKSRGASSSSSTLADSASLRALLPAAQRHLVPEGHGGRDSPIAQVCTSMSLLRTDSSSATPTYSNSHDQHNEALRMLMHQQQQQQHQQQQEQQQEQPEVVRVKEAWVEVPQPVVKRRSRKKEDISDKRRSYHAQEYLAKVLNDQQEKESVGKSVRLSKSGSQGNLSMSEAGSSGRLLCCPSGVSAEYPFQNNVCAAADHTSAASMDLGHKRGLFVALYSAVERLLAFTDASDPSVCSSSSARIVLLTELCPALHAIAADGLKTEVITSFGKMQTSVWQVVEAVTRQGNATSSSATADLVMMLNSRFSASVAPGHDDEKKFAGFIVGLLNMSSLHLWFSRLKWSVDVLLRFYERHSFLVALHKETRLLFDELVFCLQRLYAVPFRMDFPFVTAAIDQLPASEFFSSFGRGRCSRTHSCCTTPTSGPVTPTSETSSCSKRSAKSRIPRPISLPKRLEAKLGEPQQQLISPTRAGPRATSGSRSPSATPSIRPTFSLAPPASRPTTASSRRSRVRDTVRLFDANARRSAGTMARPVSAVMGVTRETSSSAAKRRSGGLSMRATGAGEALATDSSACSSNNVSIT